MQSTGLLGEHFLLLRPFFIHLHHSGLNIPRKDVTFCRKMSLLAGVCDLSLLVSFYFFSCISPVFLTPFTEETVFPPWYAFPSFVIDEWAI